MLIPVRRNHGAGPVTSREKPDAFQKFLASAIRHRPTWAIWIDLRSRPRGLSFRFFIFPRRNSCARRQIERSAPVATRFQSSETSRKKMSSRHDKLPLLVGRWPRTRRTRGRERRTSALHFPRKTASFCARRATRKKSAFDRVLQSLTAFSVTVSARRRVAVIFQRIGLAEGTKIAAQQPQNVIGRFRPTSVEQLTVRRDSGVHGSVMKASQPQKFPAVFGETKSAATSGQLFSEVPGSVSPPQIRPPIAQRARPSSRLACPQAGEQPAAERQVDSPNQSQRLS